MIPNLVKFIYSKLKYCYIDVHLLQMYNCRTDSFALPLPCTLLQFSDELMHAQTHAHSQEPELVVDELKSDLKASDEVSEAVKVNSKEEEGSSGGDALGENSNKGTATKSMSYSSSDNDVTKCTHPESISVGIKDVVSKEDMKLEVSLLS